MKAAVALLVGAAVIGVGAVAVAAMADRCVKMQRGGVYRFSLKRDFNGEIDEVFGMGFVSVTTNVVGDPTHPDAIDVQAVWAGENGVNFCPPKGMTPPEYVTNLLASQRANFFGAV